MAKPWVYNWWMGSAVDAAGLEYQCSELKAKGFGGFHVIPIYGAEGYEQAWRDYLSPRWLEAWRMANDFAAKYDLGVDLTTGTGWCFGGEQLKEQDGCQTLVYKGKRLEPELTGQQVKRSGPGGHGPMMNPLSVRAMRNFLAPFERAFNGEVPVPGSFYHDSYEYFNAAWSDEFFEAFKAKRGYDLKARWKDFAAKFPDDAQKDAIAELKCDYRETLSDIIIEDVFPLWIDFAHRHGAMTRNEAHGSPANLLDFYALADIPETEMFGKDDRDILISKFASSAAHVMKKPYVGAESCTWIDEHFCERPEEIKLFVDRLLLSGVNHMFYHGLCYSPVEAVWPGWCFYASLEMNPRNPIWREVGSINEYITRVQSMMQTMKCDNDLLIYWPIRDFWWDAEGFEKQLTVHARDWFHGQRFGQLSRSLFDAGWQFDFVSDRMLQQADLKHYRAVLVPKCAHMPDKTRVALEKLAEGGMKVIYDDGHTSQVIAALNASGIKRSPLADAGLISTRWNWNGKTVYFVVNQTKAAKEVKTVNDKRFTVMNPLDGAIKSVDSVRIDRNHSCFLIGDDFAGEGASAPEKGKELKLTWKLKPICGGPEPLPEEKTVTELKPWNTLFSGTMLYETTFDGAITKLDLGEVREIARVRLNGVELGVKFMPPYVFEVPEGTAKASGNVLEVEVTNLGANRLKWNDLNGVKWKYFTDINMVSRDYKALNAAKYKTLPSGLMGPLRIW